ncbi:unnamed protein product [Vicia faba]|uniref:Uncharacterized protein n=1 Tax=Vicia faba TaxID=3906 RepID=A0AAV0Z4L1_VICFA|nr:unnamed protein product [Vicia faba]
MGKAFGWCSGFSLMYFPLWVIMFMSAFLGLLGYGFQWLVIQRLIALPYFLQRIFLPSIVNLKQLSYCTLPTIFSLVDNNDENELHKELIYKEDNDVRSNESVQSLMIEKSYCFANVLEKEKIIMLGEEHTTKMLIRRWDFWLYYIAYFRGGTIGLVYSNNLGQISQSLGYNFEKSSLVTLYSTCSFFGRLLAAAPDLFSSKTHIARTGWFATALVPTPIAFILLAISGTKTVLQLSRSLIGLSSGFVFSAAVSITSELFGPNSVGVNHNILITNIPLGSCLYGLLAALIYDSKATSSGQSIWLREMSLCMGRKCYMQTFIWWGCISIVGLVSSFLLFLRTNEPSEGDAINILMGIRDKFEEHHKCIYTEDALKAAVHLSTRYIADRYLPNKVIDLIDEAGSKASIEAFKMKKERNCYLLSTKKPEVY